MGKKIEMAKIEDNTKCQVTFSKRRSSLVEKAEKISIICDVDVALIAFSPSGRITKFCNRERIEDLLDRYVNLPTEKRLSHIKNIQAKVQKLKELGTIRNEEGKLQYLNDQIQNLESQIERKQIEVQLAEANLGDYELNPAQAASLQQLSWCERNLQQCFDKVNAKKNEKLLMENENATRYLHNEVGKSLQSIGASSCNEQLQMQLESWRNNKYIYPENISNEMLGKGKGKELANTCGVSENNTKPTSYGMHQFGFPETQTWSQNNTCNAQTPCTYGMHQPAIAFTPSTYAPSQVNLGHEYPQQYGQCYASDMDYQRWKETPVPWQQLESNSSFGKFAGESSNFRENYLPNYWSGFPESYPSNVTCTTADASNCWEIPMLQNNPEMALGDMYIDANNQGIEGDNENKEENENVYNEMIISPPPSVLAPASTSGVPSFIPSEDRLGDDAPWTQKIQDTDMWDWDKFNNLNFGNVDL